MSRRYRVSHHTTYEYDEDVTDSYGLVYARPRDLPGQRVDEHELWTDPGHADLARHEDADGNQFAYFHVTEPHRRLSVSAVSVVSCEPSPLAAEAGAVPWEEARPLLRGDLVEAPLLAQFAVPSALVSVDGEVAAYAAASFAPGRPLLEAATELMHRVHTDFEYRPGSTSVSTPVATVLRDRRGVCQDFAHLMAAALRSHGLAARYVSGYLSTDPPPGRPRMVGADATHAWVHCWVPGHGWLALDPTNDCQAGDRHVTVAWGRDYADVPPVKGVIFTEARESTMRVAVDVVPLDPA